MASDVQESAQAVAATQEEVEKVQIVTWEGVDPSVTEQRVAHRGATYLAFTKPSPHFRRTAGEELLTGNRLARVVGVMALESRRHRERRPKTAASERPAETAPGSSAYEISGRDSRLATIRLANIPSSRRALGASGKCERSYWVSPRCLTTYRLMRSASKSWQRDTAHAADAPF